MHYSYDIDYYSTMVALGLIWILIPCFWLFILKIGNLKLPFLSLPMFIVVSIFVFQYFGFFILYLHHVRGAGPRGPVSPLQRKRKVAAAHAHAQRGGGRVQPRAVQLLRLLHVLVLRHSGRGRRGRGRARVGGGGRRR